MNLGRDDLRKLTLPALACALLLGAGAGLVWSSRDGLAHADGRLAAARAEQLQIQEKLMRIADEEREVREKLKIYRQLQAGGILGEEKRIEWADAIKRIRAERELLDLRFRVERQKLLATVPGDPSPIEINSSTMRVQLALLHEGDLLRFIRDLRESGNAYYAVRRCRLERAERSAAASGIAPRLRADCDIELITILDKAAKS